MNVNGIFQKEIVPSLLKISISLKFTPWISSQIYREPPGVFHFFALPTLEIYVFSSIFGVPPWIFLLIFSIGGSQFFPQLEFLEKPNGNDRFCSKIIYFVFTFDCNFEYFLITELWINDKYWMLLMILKVFFRYYFLLISVFIFFNKSNID